MHPFQSKQFTANGIWNLLNLSIFNSMHSSSCSRWPSIPSGEDTLTYKTPFLLDGAEVGTANVCSVILLLYVFFADWILISWYFIFRYSCLLKQDTVQSCWLVNHFSPWSDFTHLCVAPGLISILGWEILYTPPPVFPLHCHHRSGHWSGSHS